MKYRAVLFDLDGTLLDTLEDLAASVNRGLAMLGLPQQPVESFRYFVGDGREEMVRRALPPEKRDKADFRRMVDFVNRDYSLHWSDHTCLYPGISELLDGLTRLEIKMAVLSNKPHDFTREMVSKLLNEWYFESVRGALPGVPTKPDCTQALNIAGSMGIPTAEFICCGDSGTDMQTAVNAGMFPVGVLWGFRTSDELRDGGAGVLIEKPSELLEYLTGYTKTCKNGMQ
ncbi:MAG: HAD family hydrolase [Dehalococcoidales bacterium]|nr:HAD family hydrolase [Dehalococcoidales bacterium]